MGEHTSTTAKTKAVTMCDDHSKTSDPAVGSTRLLGEITLTIEEIRDLAQFAGMVIQGELTDAEKEDERETEITIAEWPARGVEDDDGPVPPHKHIAYFSDYPEEGCIPLGSPNVAGEPQPRKPIT